MRAKPHLKDDHVAAHALERLYTANAGRTRVSGSIGSSGFGVRWCPSKGERERKRERVSCIGFRIALYSSCLAMMPPEGLPLEWRGDRYNTELMRRLRTVDEWVDYKEKLEAWRSGASATKPSYPNRVVCGVQGKLDEELTGRSRVSTSSTFGKTSGSIVDTIIAKRLGQMRLAVLAPEDGAGVRMGMGMGMEGWHGDATGAPPEAKRSLEGGDVEVGGGKRAEEMAPPPASVDAGVDPHELIHKFEAYVRHIHAIVLPIFQSTIEAFEPVVKDDPTTGARDAARAALKAYSPPYSRNSERHWKIWNAKQKPIAELEKVNEKIQEKKDKIKSITAEDPGADIAALKEEGRKLLKERNALKAEIEEWRQELDLPEKKAKIEKIDNFYDHMEKGVRIGSISLYAGSILDCVVNLATKGAFQGSLSRDGSGMMFQILGHYFEQPQAELTNYRTPMFGDLGVDRQNEALFTDELYRRDMANHYNKSKHSICDLWCVAKKYGIEINGNRWMQDFEVQKVVHNLCAELGLQSVSGKGAERVVSNYTNLSPVTFVLQAFENLGLEGKPLKDKMVKKMASVRALGVAIEAASFRLRKEYRGQTVATKWQLGFHTPNLIGWDVQLDQDLWLQQNMPTTRASIVLTKGFQMLDAMTASMQRMFPVDKYPHRLWFDRTAEGLAKRGSEAQRGSRKIAVLTQTGERDGSGKVARHPCIEFGFSGQLNTTMSRAIETMREIVPKADDDEAHFLRYLNPKAIDLEQKFRERAPKDQTKSGQDQALDFRSHPTYRVSLGSSGSHAHFFLKDTKRKTLFCLDPWKASCGATKLRSDDDDADEVAKKYWQIPPAIKQAFDDYDIVIVTRPPEQCREGSCQLVSFSRAVFLAMHAAADPSLSFLTSEIRTDLFGVNNPYVPANAQHWDLSKGLGPMAVTIAVLAFTHYATQSGNERRLELFL